jgi:dolichol-phosphate mannosyltransferase
MATFRVLIVTPTYNERENLQAFIQGVHAVLPDAHVMIVDDASPDGTGQLADQLARNDDRIRVRHRPGKLGIASAYLEAFRWGMQEGYEVLFEMDTDLSHDPVYLPAFMEAIEQGADVVVGSRNMPGGSIQGWGLGRHVLSKGGSLYSRVMLGLSVRDLTSGYKAFRTDALRSMDLHAVRAEGYAFQIELTYRAIRRGMRVVEVPIVFVDRRAGQSKMSRRIFAEAVLMIPKLRWDAWRGKL